MKILFDDDTIPGTRLYPDKTIAEIAAIDPKFLKNFQRTAKKFCISDEVMQHLTQYKKTTKTTKVNKPGIELSKSLGAVRGPS